MTASRLPTNGPLLVVLRQLAAYNSGHLDAFLDTYAAEATVEEREGRLHASGHAELRAMYAPRLEPPRGRATMHVRTVTRNQVAGREMVAVFEGDPYQVDVEYTVEQDKISHVVFARTPAESAG